MANIYDMMRAKAKSMGHAAAKLPDDAWQKYMDMQDDREVLRNAKLYVENYMMGKLDPMEFAQAMAENDRLRYTISDLCRMRLEPVDLDIQRNNSYIDVVAGVKTFWTEIRVPLPSEVDAAREIRNLSIGIEAGKAASGNVEKQGTANAEPEKKRSFREWIGDTRKRMEEKAMGSILTAKGVKDHSVEVTHEGLKVDESWLDTDEGREYRDGCTFRTARQIENVVMDIEAGKDRSLDRDERRKALEAAGMSGEAASEMVSENPETDTEQMDTVQAADTNDMEAGSQEKQPGHDGSDVHDRLRSGYSEADLNSPLNDEMKQLFDQVLRHVDNDRKNSRGRNADVQAGQESVQTRINGEFKGRPVSATRIKGEFEGKPVSFKGSFSTHEFTDDEAKRLLSGEAISFSYTDKNGQERDVSGRLEWQENNGRKFLGFKADFNSSKKDAAQDMEAPLFSEADEALMNYYMGGGEDSGLHTEDFPASYAENGSDMELSAADCAALFDDGDMQM